MDTANATLKIIKNDPRVFLPVYSSEGAAGMDLRAFLASELLIPPGRRAKIPTGLRIEIPPGFEAQVRPRSGLAARFGVTILNSPGTIDSDYRGELEIILVNFGEEDFVVKDGDRIAQMVIAPVSRAVLLETDSITETKRGAGGFGSTGF
jgi:dUTP pyrophosphatase